MVGLGLRRCLVVALVLAIISPIASAQRVEAEATGSYVYLTQGGDIDRVNLDGTRLADFIDTPARYLAADDAHIYWTRPGGIGRAELDGTHVQTDFISLSYDPVQLVLEGSYLYWSTDTKTGRASILGSDIDEDFIDQGGYLVANSTHLYWLKGGYIARAKLDGSELDPHFLHPPARISSIIGIAASEDSVYYSYSGGPLSGTYVYRVPADGGAETLADQYGPCASPHQIPSGVIAFGAGGLLMDGLYSPVCGYNQTLTFPRFHAAAFGPGINHTHTSITGDAPDPSLVGDPVSIQYSVFLEPPGTVTVSDGQDNCQGDAARPDTKTDTGTASCTVTFTTVGDRTLTASYEGTQGYDSSSSEAVAHTVVRRPTQLTITNAPSVTGEPVGVTLRVTNSVGSYGTPTGTVSVTDGTVSCSADATEAGCVLVFASAGPRTLTATYVGDGVFEPTTATAQQRVDRSPTTTTITGDSPDPSTAGEAVTVSYTVTAPYATPEGNVTVVARGGNESCTATVAAGQCSLVLQSGGIRALVATYEGNGSFLASTSPDEPHDGGGPDTTRPSVRITTSAHSPTYLARVPVRVQFDEPVVGFVAHDVVASNAKISGFRAVDGDTYTFTLVPVAPGRVTVNVAADVATDSAGNGNRAARTFTFRHNKPFVFSWLRPTKAPPALNPVRAGSTAAVTFTLDGNRGFGIFANGWPQSRPVDCATLKPLGPSVATRPLGKRGLSYRKASDSYVYRFSIPVAWGKGSGSCRDLRFTLVDGSAQHVFLKIAKSD